MVERYLGKQGARDIFMAAMITGLMTEKQAHAMAEGFEKGATVKDILANLASAGKLLGGAGGVAVDAAKMIPPAVGWAVATGATTGILGTMAYDAIKERMSQEDPEAKFDADLEALYNRKNRELKDAAWMKRVRSMRDDLRRNYKKMSTEEYAAKYKALEDALDERK